MRDIRETSFECRFDSASRHRVAHVRAWDAKEALQLFEAELRADGVEEAGAFAVAPVRRAPPSRPRKRPRAA
jgi:hypothetical protein